MRPDPPDVCSAVAYSGANREVGSLAVHTCGRQSCPMPCPPNWLLRAFASPRSSSSYRPNAARHAARRRPILGAWLGGGSRPRARVPSWAALGSAGACSAAGAGNALASCSAMAPCVPIPLRGLGPYGLLGQWASVEVGHASGAGTRRRRAASRTIGHDSSRAVPGCAASAADRPAVCGQLRLGGDDRA